MTELHRVNVRVLRGNICAFPPAAQLLQRKGLKHSSNTLLSVGERPQNRTILWDTLSGASPAPVSPALPRPTTAPASSSRAPAPGSVLLQQLARSILKRVLVERLNPNVPHILSAGNKSCCSSKCSVCLGLECERCHPKAA